MSFDARVVALGEALRAEGVAIGTSELNDAFAALEQVPWTVPADFREALAATLAKSPDDRRVFDLVFDRFMFRAAEAGALAREVREAHEDGLTGGERIELDNLREQLLTRFGAVYAGRKNESSRCSLRDEFANDRVDITVGPEAELQRSADVEVAWPCAYDRHHPLVRFAADPRTC